MNKREIFCQKLAGNTHKKIWKFDSSSEKTLFKRLLLLKVKVIDIFEERKTETALKSYYSSGEKPLNIIKQINIFALPLKKAHFFSLLYIK